MRRKFYFVDYEPEHCYQVDYFEDGEIVHLAVPDKSKDYFYCRAKGESFLTIMDNGLNSCGKECDEYEPKNGKNGICRYKTYCHKKSNDKYIIKDGRAVKLK